MASAASTARGLLSAFLGAHGMSDRGARPRQEYTDRRDEAVTFSVEAMVCDALANLALSGFQLQVAGTSSRARLLDATADRFVRRHAVTAMSVGERFGDALVVPVWTRGAFEHAVVSPDDFRITACAGDEVTGIAYVVERRRSGGAWYALVQTMELLEGGTARMRLRACTDSGSEVDLSQFPDWAAAYAGSWEIEGAGHLPIARFKSWKADPLRPNAVYGVPVCHGAGRFIRELHYLVEQQHNEFELSEKGVIADKTMFVMDERDALSMPRGKQRLFMKVNGARSIDADALIKEWAPTIQVGPYSEAIEQQKRLVEQAVGVDSGIISKPDNSSYENVDSVRKSMRKTQAFVEASRDAMEEAVSQLVRAWGVLLDYNGVPTGEFSYNCKWSDDYINTFADQREALVAGYQMGAIDAVDYRVFTTGEPVEEARARVAEIAAGRSSSLVMTARGGSEGF